MPSSGLFEEKVQSYLDGLSPEARRMLARRLKTADSTEPPAAQAGEAAAPPARPRFGVPTELFDARAALFAPFEPFVVDDPLPDRQPGWLRRSTFEGIWLYLLREGMPERMAALESPREMPVEAAARARRETIPRLADEAFALLARIELAGRQDPRLQQKFTGRIGGETALADLRDMIALRPRLPALSDLLSRLPPPFPATEAAEKTLLEHLSPHVSANREGTVFAAAGVAPRLATAASLVRAACQIAGSGEVLDVRRSPAAPLVDVALSMAERHTVRFGSLLMTGGDLAALLAEIKAFHDVARGTALAMNVEDDRLWQGRMTALRRAISQPLVEAAHDVVPALRRAFGGDPFSRPTEEDRAQALRSVALLAAARRYREALAVNAPVDRLWPIAEQALQTWGRPTIDRLRKAGGREREDLVAASALAVEVGEQIHGADYAALMRRARDKALAG